MYDFQFISGLQLDLDTPKYIHTPYKNIYQHDAFFLKQGKYYFAILNYKTNQLDTLSLKEISDLKKVNENEYLVSGNFGLKLITIQEENYSIHEIQELKKTVINSLQELENNKVLITASDQVYIYNRNLNLLTPILKKR